MARRSGLGRALCCLAAGVLLSACQAGDGAGSSGGTEGGTEGGTDGHGTTDVCPTSGASGSGTSSGTSGTSGMDMGTGETPPHNVLLITSDDLGLQVGVYGEERIETPTLDALAGEGVRFDAAYVTQASCSSSRSSWFTGLYPHTNGQYGLTTVGFKLHPELEDQNITRYLKDEGFCTGVIGKISVKPEAAFPFDYKETDVHETRDIHLVADRAAAFLASAEGKPFFLMVNYSDPHTFPLDGGGWGWPVDVLGYPENPIPPGPDTLFNDFQGVDSPEQRERVANYLNSVRRLDDGIALVLAELEATGRADNTLVMFIGDHGPPFERGKMTNYEAGLRVPLIIRWPGEDRSPQVSSSMVTGVDIAPTILDAVGITDAAPMQGKSLWPLSMGEPIEDREHLVSEFHFHGSSPFFPRRSIRNQAGHKLIHNILAGQSKPPKGAGAGIGYALSQLPEYDGTPVREIFDRFADPPEYELYDLSVDPWEWNNLAGDPEWAAVQQELTDALAEWQIETDDPFRDPDFVDQIWQDSMPMAPSVNH